MRVTRKKQALIYFLVTIVVLIWLIPIYWTVITSFKGNEELRSSSPTFFPTEITVDHYKDVIFGSNYFTFMMNSLVVATCVVVITLILATCAAFALSRLQFQGKNFVSTLILLVYLFPGILLIIPLFRMMSGVGLGNNLLSLVFIHVLLTIPFATWTLKSFFDDIPTSLVSAALIDGANYFQIIKNVYVPLTLPGLAVVAIFSFVVSWNDYIFAVVMISDNELYTLPVGIAAWTSSYSINWGSLTAASNLTILPVFIFFAILGRLFVRGLTAGATKG